MQPNYASMLSDILREPGKLSDAYRAFHNYSLGNQMAAAVQLAARGLDLSPIASFMAWKDKGRSVKKGAKAIALCMPITMKGKRETATGETEEYGFSRFVWKNNWFALSDTEGQDYAAEVKSPAWNYTKALSALEVTEATFSHLNGNVQGYASGRSIAINPVAAMPHKTRFHELAHVVLGHCAEGTMADCEQTPVDIREVEAESVAYILCALLGLPGAEESRGYVQHWAHGSPITEKSAQRIYAAADRIYKAGAV